jgi:hypothetical protein
MFVVNCTPTEAPNPGCCTNTKVMCAKCAAQAIANEHPAQRSFADSFVTNFNAQTFKPVSEPLGIPVYNFERPTDSAVYRGGKPQDRDRQSKPEVVTNSRWAGCLGIPTYDF